MLKYCGWLRKPAPVDRWFIMVYPCLSHDFLGFQPSASSRGARFRWPIHPQYVEIPPKHEPSRGFCKCSRSVSAPVPPSPSYVEKNTPRLWKNVGWRCDDQWVRLQMGYTMVCPTEKKGSLFRLVQSVGFFDLRFACMYRIWLRNIGFIDPLPSHRASHSRCHIVLCLISNLLSFHLQTLDMGKKRSLSLSRTTSSVSQSKPWILHVHLIWLVVEPSP